MRKALKKSLIISGLVYVGLSALVAFHLPSRTNNQIKSRFYQVLLLPFQAPPILRSYGAFVFAGVWPFAAKQNVLDYQKFIDDHANGSEFGEKVVSFNLTPDVPPGREGRVTLTLGSEHYTVSTFGAWFDYDGGAIIKIGRYFCEAPTGSAFTRLFGGPHCDELIRRPNGEFYLHHLGSEKASRIALIAR